MPSLLDRELPEFHWSEFHETRIARPPEKVREAVLALRVSDLRLTGLLMGIRTLPSLLTGRRTLRPGGGPMVEELSRAGFVLLVDTDRELVMGVVGRFWQLRARPLPLEGAAAFREFREPGFAKAAWNFRFEPDGEGTRLTTETRIQATDDAARRTFGRYWRVIQPGSGLIRRDILAAVRRRASRRTR